MSDHATKEDITKLSDDLKSFEKRVDGKFDDFEKRVDAKIDKAVTDLSDVIAGFAEQVDARFNKIESEVADIKSSLDRLQNTMDSYLKRLEEIEVENGARDARFDRLLDWARSVSAKTGIPLKDL